MLHEELVCRVSATLDVLQGKWSANRGFRESYWPTNGDMRAGPDPTQVDGDPTGEVVESA
jgi:hypothetical protein